MKRTRFTEEQMVTILREADEKSVPEVARKHPVSPQTIYAWRKHFGTLDAADVKRPAVGSGNRRGSRCRVGGAVGASRVGGPVAIESS